MRHRFAIVALLVLLVACAGWWLYGRAATSDTRETSQPLGLFTGLPIIWGEQAELRDVLAAPDDPHWAKSVLDQHGKVIALNTLLNLAQFERLVIAQPRPFSPDENVALDAWVRSGGKVLLFADPLLTEDSAFGLGDRRRPPDVVLISPILARWGLELRFDDAQAVGLRENAGEAMTVNLPGQLVVQGGGADARCKMGAEGLIARCKVGKGRVTLVADAALLEMQGGQAAQIDRFGALLRESLGT